MIRTISKTVAPLKRRVYLMISRAVVALVHDARKLQEVQITGFAGETIDGAERVQQYGFTSVPHAGAEAILLSIGGNRSHPVVIAVDDRRYRLTALEGGEVALYDDQDQKIHIKRDGIEISSPFEVKLVCGDSSLVLQPSAVRLVTPDFEASEAP
jgi:phage baseplate assembly protein V